MSGLGSASLRVYGWFEQKIVPGQCNTQIVYRDRLYDAVEPGCDWLDLGCGHQIFPDWMPADQASLVARCHRAAGVDIDFPSLQKNTVLRDRAMGNLENLPYASASFDLVTANLVVEHLSSPGPVMAEVSRVLRPGGRFMFHTPNKNAPSMRMAARSPQWLKNAMARVLEQRAAEDVFPTHYCMNTPEDIRRYAESAGLQIERIEQLNTNAVTAMLGPLALPELLFHRMLRADRFRDLRSNIIAVLRK